MNKLNVFFAAVNALVLGVVLYFIGSIALHPGVTKDHLVALFALMGSGYLLVATSKAIVKFFADKEWKQ